MPRPKMRPSFRLQAACSASELHDVIERHLVSGADEIEGDLSDHNGVLRVPEARRRFWTPCLDLTIEEIEPESSEVQRVSTKLWGTFSPRAEVWTAFVFTIGTLVIVSIFSTIFGIAQLVLGHAPMALLIPLAAIFVAGIVYASALVGQGLSIAEMYRLRAFVDECLREAEETAARRPMSPRESAQL